MNPSKASVAKVRRARWVVLLLAGAVTASLAGGLSAAGCVIDWADDCARDRGLPGCKGGTSSTTGVGAGGTGGTTGSSSSGTGGVPCNDPKDCQPPAGLCASLWVVACTNHLCEFSITPGPAPSQAFGNCRQNWCDDAGVATSVPDPSNKYVSENPCVGFDCTDAGTVITKLVDGGQGASCPLQGSTTGYCDLPADPSSTAPLVCAACDATSCTGGWTCTKGKCVPPSCTNMKIDVGESDIDCGGICPLCVAGQKCVTYKDCFSGLCTGSPLTCQAPSCSDQVLNGDETDRDCGGKTCPPCPPTSNCALPRDCASGVCKPGGGSANVCQTPTCIDGVKNGNETGIDCGNSSDGGTGCPPCADAGP